LSHSFFSKRRRERIFSQCGDRQHTCPSGEIGRHSGLKIRRLPEKGRTGSIPVSGTILIGKTGIPVSVFFPKKYTSPVPQNTVSSAKIT
jgi:hypothetical protein